MSLLERFHCAPPYSWPQTPAIILTCASQLEVGYKDSGCVSQVDHTPNIHINDCSVEHKWPHSVWLDWRSERWAENVYLLIDGIVKYAMPEEIIFKKGWRC